MERKKDRTFWPSQFRSCFIVDVAIELRQIVLTDSSQNRYYIDIERTEVVAQFKKWFKNVFTKGIAQTLTVLQYSTYDVSECETKLIVDKIFLKNENSWKDAEISW